MTTLTASVPVLRLTSSDRMLLRLAIALTDLVDARRARRAAMRSVEEHRAAHSAEQRLAAARWMLGMPPR